VRVTFAFSMLAFVGCSSAAEVPQDQPGADGAVDVQPTTSCRAKASIDVVPVAEVRGKTPVAIDVTIAEDGGATGVHPLKVVLVRDGTIVKTLVDAPKDLGKIPLTLTPGDEKDLATGAYTVKANVGCPASATNATPGEASVPLYLARLGATSISVAKGEGGGRVPLMYHAVAHVAANYFPIPDTIPSSSMAIPAGEPELDAKDGTARTFAAPWDDLDTPPTDSSGAVLESGGSLPTSLVVGTKPDLVFTIGKTTKSATGTQPTGLAVAGIPKIRVVVDGTPGSDTALVTEGGSVTVRLASTPVPAIDRVELALKWHFEAQDSKGAWIAIPDATQQATLRFYGVLGNDQGTLVPNLPWVRVVDLVTKRIAGKATDAALARATLVQLVYEESGLKYDRKSGASAYTGYTGSPTSWTSARFSLGSFLNRSLGTTVNCSDCASILSTYANMIGAKLHYAIIGFTFNLNPIMGIGSTTFGSPFDSGRTTFNYHAVTTRDATAHIHDATLALDGDSDPKTAPQTKLLAQDLTGVDYLTRLSPDTGSNPAYKYTDQSTSVR